MSPGLWWTPGDCRGLQGTRRGNGFGGESSLSNGSRAPSLFSQNLGRGFDSCLLHQKGTLPFFTQTPSRRSIQRQGSVPLLMNMALIGVGCRALRVPIDESGRFAALLGRATAIPAASTIRLDTSIFPARFHTASLRIRQCPLRDVGEWHFQLDNTTPAGVAIAHILASRISSLQRSQTVHRIGRRPCQ
jgi:hypothetical protein